MVLLWCRYMHFKIGLSKREMEFDRLPIKRKFRSLNCGREGGGREYVWKRKKN